MLGQGPEVSVIVAVTRPGALGAALAGIADQKIAGPIEVVLVWDGLAPAPVGSWPFTVVSVPSGSSRRAGLARTWNTGIETARAQVLAICDDDDRWRPDHLDAALRLLGGPCDAVHGAAWVLDAASGRRHPFHFPLSPEILRHTNPVIPSTAVFTRRAWERTGPFDPGLRFYTDWDWVLRSVAAGVVWRRIEHPTVDYVWAGPGGNDSAARGTQRAAELARLCARHGLDALPVADFFAMATDRRWDAWRLPVQGWPEAPGP